MELSMNYSFSKPSMQDRVAKGDYPNIRLFMYGAGEFRIAHNVLRLRS
jgi:hypothetical protein